MTNERYRIEVDKRGGRKAVAEALGLPLSTINRRINGETRTIKGEAASALLSLPVHPNWDTLRRLKNDRKYRHRFRLETLALPHGEQRRKQLELLAEAAAHVPGRKILAS